MSQIDGQPFWGIPVVMLVYRNNAIINIVVSYCNNANTRFRSLHPTAGSAEDAVSIVFEVGDRVDVYAYATELGYTLLCQHDVTLEDTATLVVTIELPKKSDQSSYTWNHFGQTVWGRVLKLGYYAGSYAGHNFANVLSAADSELTVKFGSSVFFFYPSVPQNSGAPGTRTATVFDVDYTANVAWAGVNGSMTYSYSFCEPTSTTVKCTGSTDVSSFRSYLSNGTIPINLPFEYENELFTTAMCAYEPTAIVTFLRGTRQLEHEIVDVTANISYEGASMQVLAPLGSSLTITGCDYSVTSTTHDIYTLTGYVGDVISYTFGDVTGSIILTNDEDIIDLRTVPSMVILTIIAPSGVIASSTSGVITHGVNDTLVINDHPGAIVTVGCMIEEELLAHEVTIPEVNTTLDWTTEPWWSDDGETTDPVEDPTDPGTFTPEARLEKIHCVNYGSTGDISLRVRKAGLIPSYEVISVPSGEHDYLFDMATYGYTSWFSAPQFWAEVTLPNGVQVINEPWPSASTQWSIIYGTPSPEGEGEGSELGFITVSNPTAQSVTLLVRTNLLLSTFDVVGVIDSQSTVSYPILDSYLSSLGRDVIRCKLVGENGTFEKDYVYPESHLIFIEYPSSKIRTGDIDWNDVLKYGAIGVGVLALLGIGMYLISFLRKN